MFSRIPSKNSFNAVLQAPEETPEKLNAFLVRFFHNQSNIFNYTIKELEQRIDGLSGT